MSIYKPASLPSHQVSKSNQPAARRGMLGVTNCDHQVPACAAAGQFRASHRPAHTAQVALSHSSQHQPVQSIMWSDVCTAPPAAASWLARQTRVPACRPCGCSCCQPGPASPRPNSSSATLEGTSSAQQVSNSRAHVGILEVRWSGQ